MEFKQRELIFAYKEQSGFSTEKSVMLPLLMSGLKCELGYEKGDMILFDIAAAEKRKIQDREYYILTSEIKAICKI